MFLNLYVKKLFSDFEFIMKIKLKKIICNFVL